MANKKSQKNISLLSDSIHVKITMYPETIVVADLKSRGKNLDIKKETSILQGFQQNIKYLSLFVFH